MPRIKIVYWIALTLLINNIGCKSKKPLYFESCNNIEAKRIFLLKIDTLDLKLWAKLSDASINDRVLAEIEKLTDIHANKVSVEFYGEVGTELQYIAKWKNWYKENKNDLCFDNSKGTLYLGSSIK